MNLARTIYELYVEKEKLDRTIAVLEALTNPAGAPRRRGRKSLSAEERRQTSQRMMKYWADRSSGSETT